jgi:hypothetical protein
MGMLVLGGVFERHPNLKIVCVEADAGWVPHFMYRMDHAYKRHRYWLPAGRSSRMPSEYFADNIYVTFQDDWTAFRFADAMNWKHCCGRTTSPQRFHVAVVAGDVGGAHRWIVAGAKESILSANTAELYGIDRARWPPSAEP